MSSSYVQPDGTRWINTHHHGDHTVAGPSLIAELNGAPSSAPIDPIADMIAFNGGEPLSCLA